MKKIFIIILLPLLAVSLVGCSKFVDGYDVSPNSPTTVTSPLLLSAAELGLQTTYTSGVDRISSILVQQIAGTKEQMLAVAKYALLEGDNKNDWNTVYGNVVQTSNDLIVKAGSENPYYLGIAKTIKAMGLGFATDVWGDVPSREAGMGNITGNTTPKFESQEAVYVYIQELLAEAQVNFAATSGDNNILPGTDDFFFGGDIDQWKNATKILQARYANHLSQRDPSGSANKVLAFLGTNVVDASNIVDLTSKAGTSTSEINQWYAFEKARPDYIKAGKNYVDMLTAKNDPRLPFYFAKNASGLYSGSPVGDPDLSASTVGTYIASQTSTIPIVTSVEALFLQAEAALRASNNDLAARAYNAAVKTSIKTVTGADADATYIANYASETSSSITLQKIIEQKYLSLFVNIEVWTDWRRTGFPVLTANPTGAAVSGIPHRLMTVIDERKYNPNVIVVSDILKPLWIENK
jgi:hypothetical protein